MFRVLTIKPVKESLEMKFVVLDGTVDTGVGGLNLGEISGEVSVDGPQFMA